MTGPHVAAAAGVAGVAIGLVDALPYVRDVLRRRTLPHRGTWLIWAALGTTAFAAQVAAGGGWSLGVLGLQAATTTLVFVLSLGHGTGGVSRPELALLAVAAAGIAGWLLLGAPVVAALCVVVADLAGVVLMLPKTWADPWSETALTFALAAVSGLLAAVAVGRAEAGLLLYPGYYAVANLLVTSIVLGRRRRVPPPGARLVPFTAAPDDAG